MGPFPIELRKENRAISLQPRGARLGDIALATLIDKENSTSFEMLHGARDGTRTHDLLITNYDLFFSYYSIMFNKWLYHAVF